MLYCLKCFHNEVILIDIFSGADEVKVFIKQHPEILPDATLTTKIARIKTKVFNERKELRRKMAALEGNLEKTTTLKGKEEMNVH